MIVTHSRDSLAALGLSDTAAFAALEAQLRVS
jgi:hypothetical protein